MSRGEGWCKWEGRVKWQEYPCASFQSVPSNVKVENLLGMHRSAISKFAVKLSERGRVGTNEVGERKCDGAHEVGGFN